MQSWTITTNFIFAWYKRVEYIQSSWSGQTWQFIYTGLYGSNINTVEMTFAFPSLPPSDVVNLIWSREANNTAVSPIRVDTSKYMIPWFWSPLNTNYQLTANTKYTVKTIYSTSSQSTYIDWVSRWTSSISYSYSNTRNITIFWLSDNWYVWNRWAFRLYWCKLYNWNNLLRDFYPVYRKSDSVIWLLDIVNKVFYTNSWSWTFSKWPDIN